MTPTHFLACTCACGAPLQRVNETKPATEVVGILACTRCRREWQVSVQLRPMADWTPNPMPPRHSREPVWTRVVIARRQERSEALALLAEAEGS